MQRDARALDQAARGLAVGVAGAGEEGAKAAALDGHFLTAVFAILDGAFRVAFGNFRGKILNEIAFRIKRTTQKKTVTADALEEFALAALFAGFSGRDTGLVGKHLLIGAVEVHDKFFPEFLDGFAPVQLAFLDVVEFFLESRGECDVENVFKTFDEQAGDAFAEHGGREAALIFFDVFALDDGGNDGGVGGGPADALLFQVFNQRGFGIAWRRLSEMLLGANVTELEGLALFDARESVAFALVALFVVVAVRVGGRQLIDAEVAVKLLHGTGGAEGVIAGSDVDGGLVENGRKHLRSDEALPDQLIKLEEIVVQIFANVLGCAGDVGGANGFVGFLRVFLRLVVVGLFREIVGAEALRNEFADLREGVLRNVNRVGAHVGDERDGAFGAEFDTFVEALGDAHGALGGVAQAVVGRLLELGSGERRWRIAALLLLRDGSDLPFGFAHCGENGVSAFLVVDGDVFAFVLGKLGFENGRLARVQHGVDGPILLRDEGANLLFAFDDQAQGDGLHAAGGEAAAYFVPEQRGNLIADDTIEDAASLLGVHQVGVHLAGMIKGSADGLGRNLVKGDVENLFGIGGGNLFLGGGDDLFLGFGFGLGVLSLPARRAGFLLGIFFGLGENHGQVSRNGFAFAVRVAGQIDGVGRVGSLAQVVEDFGFAVNDLQGRLENFNVVEGDWLADRLDLGFFSLFGTSLFLGRCVQLIRIIGQTNAYGFFRQVEDVADGSFYGVTASQVFVNRFRLGRRFDNDERTCHLAVLTPDLVAESPGGGACVLLANGEEDAGNGRNVSRTVFGFC